MKFFNFRLLNYFLSAITLVFAIGVFFYFSTLFDTDKFSRDNTLIEGVLVPQGFNISKISPILTTNISIEKNLSYLIFEPLYKIDGNGNVLPVLAKSIQVSNGSKEIDILLKENIVWSDNVAFNAKDVTATYDVLKKLNEQSTIVDAVSNLQINYIDDYHIKIILPEYSPTILETLSFGILPKHILDKESPQNFVYHRINKTQPIGTGPYVYVSSDKSGIKLQKNKYYREKVNIDNINFKYFFTEADLVKALINSQVHITNNLKNNFINTNDYKILEIKNSQILPNRFWALFFNLSNRENLSDTDANYGKIVKNINVRRAIANVVDRDKLIPILSGISAPMYNAYPTNSLINEGKKFAAPDLQGSIILLENDGWKINPTDNFRYKDGQKLTLRLTVLNSQEKKQLAGVIKSQMALIGLDLIIIPMDNEELVSSAIKPRNFDLVLYGIETSTDPDRFRLWHSSQISETGLNISSYKSPSIVKDPISKNEVSKSDDLLVRGLNSQNKDERLATYRQFTTIIDNDVPAIFLYQQGISVILNKKLTGVDFTGALNPEDKYNNIIKWELHY